MSRQQWTPNSSLEQGKLAPKETDWRLPGSSPAGQPSTRTRNGGRGRPNLLWNKETGVRRLSSSCSEDGSSYLSGDDSELSDDHHFGEEDLDAEDSRSSPHRMIIEVNQLKKTIEEFGTCKVCSGPVEAMLSAKGFGLATKLEVTCLDPKCTCTTLKAGC